MQSAYLKFRYFPILALAGALLVACVSSQACADSIPDAPFNLANEPDGEQDIGLLMQEVEDYLRGRSEQFYPNADLTISMNPPDKRVRLPLCESLEKTVQGERRYGRIAIEIRCRKPRAWSVYLTGMVTVKIPVAVAQNTIKRGSSIQATDISMQYRVLSQLGSRYLSSVDELLGWEAKRDISKGSIIFAQQLQAFRLVHKGDRVQITSSKNGFSVAASGIALNDGIQGQQIPVRNQQSNRVIHAWVTQRGLVSTQP